MACTSNTFCEKIKHLAFSCKTLKLKCSNVKDVGVTFINEI